PPPPAAAVRIASLRGVDIAPIDLSDAAATERLLAYVWADQAERFARTEAAIALWRARPPRLDQGDAAGWVEARLAESQAEGLTRVLMHSIVWQYLPREGRARIVAAMEAAGAEATPERPLAWVRYEADRSLGLHELRVKTWPGGEDRHLANAHPHAAWVEWLGEEVA
ncbi:MAG: DUF2332 family protein, partial [Sphingomonadaceae bacterium]|nr:DUF2332 family protein [Sphingomonadaceae bacterium]